MSLRRAMALDGKIPEAPEPLPPHEWPRRETAAERSAQSFEEYRASMHGAVTSSPPQYWGFATTEAIVPAFAVAPGAQVIPSPPRYGHITTETWSRHKTQTGEELRIEFDGVDITSKCVEANDVLGFVRTHVRLGVIWPGWFGSAQGAYEATGLIITSGTVVIRPYTPGESRPWMASETQPNYGSTA